MHLGDSVHLQDYPNLENFEADGVLSETMDRVRDICSCALSIRDRNNLRIRLPLAKVTVIAEKTDDLEELSSIIMEEINVKSIEFLNNVKDFSNNRLVLNFQRLGARVDSKMPELIKAAENNRWEITPAGTLKICDFELTKDDFSTQLRSREANTFPVANRNILIKLDLRVTEELRCEGLARDLVRIIQQFRKDSNLNITDRIELFLRTGYAPLIKSLEIHRKYIEEQTLAKSLSIISDTQFNCLFSTSDEIDKNPIKIGFNLVG
ncbi:MAG: DUF5915 domain-containing protein [Rickettsiales bacterium]|jgi:isoleucyl-tRNA synthetase|nr:DUF5915 domain-containing protein [Rickettsiales bacterium]